MSKGKRRIGYDEFWATVLRHCQTQSGCARPAEGEMAYQYDCGLGDLVQIPLYTVWFVNDTRTEILDYNHPEARAIRAEELARTPLVRSRLERWFKADAGPITEAAVIILHCTGCNRRVLIDGVHRTIWLLSRGNHSAPVHVTELSGSRWPIGTPDLNVVCECHY